MKADWTIRAFEDCIEGVTYTTKIQRKNYMTEGKFPIVSQEEEFISGYWNDEKDCFKVKTPVVIFGDHTRCFKFVDFDFVLGADGVKILQPRDFLLPKFFYYQLQAGSFGSLGYARHYRLLKQRHIAYPSQSEQLRIVRLLDEAFEGLATAKVNADKNLQNARAIFENHLQSVFTQRSEGWVERRLGDIADFKNGLNFTRQSNGQTLRIVGVGDFQDNSVVPIERLQSVTIDGEIGSDYLIQRDDILTVRSNGSRDLVGRCMIVPEVDEITSFSGFIIRLRFDTREVSSRFMLHFMKSSATRGQLTRDGGGANISNINQAKLSKLPISLPSLKQQENIADRLDDAREESERLATIYARKLAALDALKQSLLHHAFAGKL